jgi:hypothetical protein
MFVGSVRLVAVLLVVVAAWPLCAQGLSGTYTCANGNPGSGFDYPDLGDFFDDLESVGVAGPVVLEVYDDGGPFVS